MSRTPWGGGRGRGWSAVWHGCGTAPRAPPAALRWPRPACTCMLPVRMDASAWIACALGTGAAASAARPAVTATPCRAGPASLGQGAAGCHGCAAARADVGGRARGAHTRPRLSGTDGAASVMLHAIDSSFQRCRWCACCARSDGNSTASSALCRRRTPLGRPAVFEVAHTVTWLCTYLDDRVALPA